MRTIEAQVVISDDRQLIMQLPTDIAPGDHRVLLMIDELENSVTESATMPMRWEGNVLVFDGTIDGPCEHFVDLVREQRIGHFLGGGEG